MKNPAKLMRMKSEYEAFAARHPKMLRYLAYISDNYLEDGARLDLTVTAADGRSLHSNARLSEQDVAFLKELKELLGG